MDLAWVLIATLVVSVAAVACGFVLLVRENVYPGAAKSNNTKPFATPAPAGPWDEDTIINIPPPRVASWEAARKWQVTGSG